MKTVWQIVINDATALGIEDTGRGIPARFFQTATLVLQLGKARREGRSTGCSPTYRGSTS